MSDDPQRCYRHCSPAHQDIGDATLEASRRVGGRFNPRAEFGALYLACDRSTALAELRRRAANLGIEPESLLPRAILSIDVAVSRVLDLTDARVRGEWGLDDGTLAGDDLRPCQEVGRAARRAGYEAIRFPSATGHGVNLAIFLDRLHPGSGVQVVDSRPLDQADPDPDEPTKTA